MFWRYRFLSWIFDHVEKGFDSKEKVNFKFYDVTTWLTNNFVFIVRQVEDCWNILTLSWKPLAFTSNKVFLNNKVGYGTIHILTITIHINMRLSLLCFLHDSWRKKSIVLCSIAWPNFHCLVVFIYFVRY